MASAVLIVTGDEAIKRAFKELEPKIAKKVIRQASRKAMQIPRSMAQAIAPVHSGRYKKSIRVRTSKGPRSAKRGDISLALLVGAGAGAKSKKGVTQPWWAWLVERGFHTGGKRIRKGGKVVGYVPKHKGGTVRHIPGKYIVKRVLKATESQVKQVMTMEILNGIEREAKV